MNEGEGIWSARTELSLVQRESQNLKVALHINLHNAAEWDLRPLLRSKNTLKYYHKID